MAGTIEAEPILRAVWIVGVLGHRRLADPSGVESVLEQELRTLSAGALARGGEIHLMASVAAGTDLLAIRAARRLGLPVHLVLPLAEEDFLEDFACHPEALPEAKAALAGARGNLERDSVSVALTRGSRPACYFDTDVRILESADLVLAVWDGQPGGGLGGTGQLVALGTAMRKPMRVIDPGRLTVTLQHYDPQAWPPFDPQWNWIVQQGIVDPAPGCTTDQERCRTIKARLSRAAQTDAFDFRHAAQQLILLGALGGLIGMTHVILAGRNLGVLVTILQALQFVLSVWALRERRRLTRVALVEKWTNARVGAEICRGLEASLPYASPFRPTAGDLLPEWRRFAVSFGVLAQRHRQAHLARQPDALATFREEYGRDRLEGQQQYFAAALVRSGRWGRRLPLIARRCAQATPIFVAGAMLNRAAKLDLGAHLWGMVLVMVLPAVLPIVAAVADGLASSFDHARRSQRFRALAQALGQRREELRELRTEDSVRDLVEKCERQLLVEQVEWRYVTRKIKV